MLSVRCPVCLSVTFVHCGQTVGPIKMKLGMQEPRPWPHCVRWRRSSPSPKGAQPPIFGPYQLRQNGCMDQDVTWYGARPRPRRLWNPLPSAIFGPFLLWPNGWMDQDVTWHGGRPQLRGICVRWGPSPHPLNFQPCLL